MDQSLPIEQVYGQRFVLGGVQIDYGCKEIVPLADERKDCDYAQSRHRHWQDDVPEDG